jgi:hypothetical protein
MIRRFASILLIAISLVGFCIPSSYAQDEHPPVKKEHVVKKKMHKVKKHKAIKKMHKMKKKVKKEKEDSRIKVN